MAINKVTFEGRTLLDLTEDTVTDETLLIGSKAHDRHGEVIEGICTFDADTSGGTAKADEILDGKVAYVEGEEVVGTMPNNGSWNARVISVIDEPGKIPKGYHDGNGVFDIDADEKRRIIPKNLRSGVNLLGVSGTLVDFYEAPKVDLSFESVFGTSVTHYDPIPDYERLGNITIRPILVDREQNDAGGITLTIG